MNATRSLCTLCTATTLDLAPTTSRAAPVCGSVQHGYLHIARRGQCAVLRRNRATRGARATRKASPKDDNSEWKMSDDELRELTEMMPDPSSDIFDPSGKRPPKMDLSEFGSDTFFEPEMMDQILTEMSGDEPAMKQMAASMAGREPVAAGQEREIVMADFEGTPEEVKRARDIANFNLKASFKNGLVGNAVRDAVQLNTLNMQRAVNRYKMTKEMARWVDFFDREKRAAPHEVRSVPSWAKAVHLINWDFVNLNETHRLEDLDDDEEEEDEDETEEEGGEDEECDGLMPDIMAWELDTLEIPGKPELKEDPQALLAEVSRMAEDILGDRSNKFAYGYMRPGTIDPPEMEAEAAKPAPRVEPKRKEEELGLPPEEEEMLISAKDAPKMTYLSPEDTKVDEQMSLLWDVVVPGQGPPETVIMGDILGDAADEEKELEEEFDDDLDLGGDLEDMLDNMFDEYDDK